jgi:dihydrofolate reductase
MSLDGFIATEDDGTSWMTADPEYSSSPFLASVDTVLMGRRSYEQAVRQGMRSWPGYRTYVFSRSLRQDEYPEVTVVADDAHSVVSGLRDEPDGKDIWLTGGGQLFRSLLAQDLVDTVEVGIIPILLGGGIPLLPPFERATKLALSRHRVFPSGFAVFEYAVQRSAG